MDLLKRYRPTHLLSEGFAQSEKNHFQQIPTFPRERQIAGSEVLSIVCDNSKDKESENQLDIQGSTQAVKYRYAVLEGA